MLCGHSRVQAWKSICVHGTVIISSPDSVSVKYRTLTTRWKMNQEVLEVMENIQRKLQVNIMSQNWYLAVLHKAEEGPWCTGETAVFVRIS